MAHISSKLLCSRLVVPSLVWGGNAGVTDTGAAPVLNPNIFAFSLIYDASLAPFAANEDTAMGKKIAIAWLLES